MYMQWGQSDSRVVNRISIAILQAFCDQERLDRPLIALLNYPIKKGW